MAAMAPRVDMRAGTRIPAGTYHYQGDDVVTGWHHHDLHQVEYALEGVAEVETEAGHYLLPPAQAIWIPAGLAHNTTLRHVRSVAVFFDPQTISEYGDRARVLAASPLLREMMTYAIRWPIGRRESDPQADAFFEAMRIVTVEALDREAPLWLPVSADLLVHAAMEHTRAHLDDELDAVCAAVGCSPRTLRRRFQDSTGWTWQDYRRAARVIGAMLQLAMRDTTVARAAVDSGFESVTSFTRAFTRATGETPSAYRARARNYLRASTRSKPV
jgi:AraC-like DNA-binding protein